MAGRVSNIKIEGAKLIFRNFEGRAGEYNAEGDRNFGVLLDPEDAEQFAEDGWRIRMLKPRDPENGDEEIPWLSVKVKFGKVPPICVLVTSRGKTKLDEETVGQLDWTRYSNVDLLIRPYEYPAMHGRPAGISAYLKSIYVTVQEDDLEMKYADIPYVDEEE